MLSFAMKITPEENLGFPARNKATAALAGGEREEVDNRDSSATPGD
jgi:hypothetical protein